MEQKPERPVFIPLKTKYFEAFESGDKTSELRQHGGPWNQGNCRVGRQVTLSKGYGKHSRISGVVTGVSVYHCDHPDFIACYGRAGECIEINIQLTKSRVDTRVDTQKDQ